MGGGSSKISADNFLLTRSRQDLLRMTASTRSFSDAIFLYLKNEMQIKSYINLLGSSTACEKFIFLLEEDLKKVFERLPVRIGQDKKGVLAFQRIDDIIKKEDSKQYTYSYCQHVARFVTRLFQLYGALALSVLDNDAILDMGASVQAGVLAGRPERRLGFRYELPREQRGGGPYDRTHIDTTNFIFKKLNKEIRRFQENEWYSSGIGIKFKLLSYKPKVSELSHNLEFVYDGHTYKMLMLFFSEIGSTYYKYNVNKLTIDNNYIDTYQKFYGLNSSINRNTPDQYVQRGMTEIIESFVSDNEAFLERQYKMGRKRDPSGRPIDGRKEGDGVKTQSSVTCAIIAGGYDGKP